MWVKRVLPSLLFVAIIGLALAYFISHGFSARDEPMAIEAWVARQLRHIAVPRAARKMANPIPANPEVLSEAMEHFADHCAFCHSNDGSGNTAIGKGLYPKTPNMREAGTQNLSDGELYYIIENGIRFTGMPAFGEETGKADNKESWDLVHFIRHLPAITGEEIAEMKKLSRMKEMNPKTPADLKEEEDINRFLEGGEPESSELAHQHHH